MIYYEDYRLTIVRNKNGTFNIHDAKYGGRALHKNKTKEWIDDYIQKVLSKRKSPSKETKNLTEWDLLNRVDTTDLAAKLIEKHDFENYNYPWLAKVIQLSLEYLTLGGLEDAYRASMIPDEILEICEKELNDTE